jgi:hypothetical protein
MVKARRIVGLSRRAIFTSLAVGTIVAGCGGPSEGTATTSTGEDGAPKARPELVVLVYDRSTSISGYQLALARQLTNERLRKLDHGDRIAAHQILQLSLSEPPRRWSQTVPRREWQEQQMARDSVTRARFLRDAQDYLVAFTDTTSREDINGTDILSTMHDVAADLRAAGTREATLYVFSDMLQSNRTIDMEGLRRMPPSNYVQAELNKGTLPDLTGLCVVVVGARVDNAASQRVKRFWDEYFEATGAVLLDRNYVHRPVTLPAPACDG